MYCEEWSDHVLVSAVTSPPPPPFVKNTDSKIVLFYVICESQLVDYQVYPCLGFCYAYMNIDLHLWLCAVLMWLLFKESYFGSKLI